MEIAFKLADEADVDRLAEFMREYYEYDRFPFDERAARNALQQIVTDETLGRVWLIELDDEAIGYVALTFGFSLMYGGRDAFVDELYLRAAHRGRGVGKQALEFVAGVCRSLGVRALHLEVDRQNTNAQALYHKFGFEDHENYLLTKWLHN